MNQYNQNLLTLGFKIQQPLLIGSNFDDPDVNGVENPYD